MGWIAQRVSIGVALGMAAVLAVAPASAEDGLDRLPSDTAPIAYRFALAPRPDDASFTARADIRFRVLTPTRRVVLSAFGLDVAGARIDGRPVTIAYDRGRQRVGFDVPAALTAGEHRLSFDWTGPISNSPDGIFRVDYKAAGGAPARMLFLNSCCINTARMFAPMWDEPAAKASFDLELTVPSGMDAVSNMPAARRSSLADGRTRIDFATTPRMSSYLLFFAIGRFDRIGETAGGTALSIVTQKGKGEQGRFALGVTRDVLGYYNDYFGQRFPLPKLDSVAFPGAGSFGAMENWGSIFYFEPRLLLDPKLQSEADRQGIHTLVAHEVAHQWFGDLVTMNWWDDLWLNEGFATWMQNKATDHFHPDWKMWLRAADDRDGAMELDAQTTTHAVVRPVRTVEEAVIAFDAISYQKGSQIVRMMEAWIGADRFRTAIRDHIARHAYANATSADLWGAIDRVSGEALSPIARSFTDQPGLPMVTLVSSRCDAARGETVAMVRQERFGVDAASRTDQAWRIPLIAGVIGGGAPTRTLLTGREPVAIRIAGCGPVKLNLGETGFFRARYDADARAALAGTFGRLDAADQIGLMNDGYALADAGYDGFAAALDFIDQAADMAEPLVALRAATLAGRLDALAGGLPMQRPLRAFIVARFAPRLGALGWTARPNDPANVGLLRTTLIDLLAKIGEPAVIAEAQRRFAAAPTDADALTPDMRAVAIGAVGAGADMATFDRLARLASDATDGSEQRLYLLALANTADPAVARRALGLVLTDAVPAAFTVRFVGTIARRHPDAAVDFAIGHFDAIAPKLDAVEKLGFVPALAAEGYRPELAERVRGFAAQRIGEAGKERVAKAEAAIAHRHAVRTTRLDDAAGWLCRHGYCGPAS